MHSLTVHKEAIDVDKESALTWAGVVRKDLSNKTMDDQPWHEDLLPLECPIDDDHEFLTSLFDEILNDATDLDPRTGMEQVTDSLARLQTNEVVTYMSSNDFRKMISECPIYNNELDSDGIGRRMEKIMTQLTSQDIDCAKEMMRDTLQSCFGLEPKTAMKREIRRVQASVERNNGVHADKTLSLIDATSPNVLDILHRPSTSTEPLDINVEALFQSPLADLYGLKLAISPQLGQLLAFDLPDAEAENHLDDLKSKAMEPSSHDSDYE